MTVRVGVAPSLYEWASERSGVDADELHRKFPKLLGWAAGDASSPSLARRSLVGMEPAAAAVGGRGRRRAAMGVEALARELAAPGWRGVDRPLVQFVMDWSRRPAERASMLAPVPEEAGEVVSAKVAAVLRALCERDGVEAPRWVRGCRLREPVGLFGLRLGSDYGRLVRGSAPGACGYHGVWFDAEMLDA